MRLDRLMAERIHSDERLANVPRPIIDAVCSVFADELAEYTYADMTTFELIDDLETCSHCGQIIPRSEAVQAVDRIDESEHLCRVCFGPAPSDATEPDITAQDRTTTDH